MADGRKRFSGAQYQKIRDEKWEKEEVLKKIPKLDTLKKKDLEKVNIIKYQAEYI